MKTIITILVSLLCFNSLSQDSSSQLFAQGLYNIDGEEQILDVQSAIRDLPSVQVARLDIPTKRFFIIINKDELTEAELASWFSTTKDIISCVQIGVYGKDTINSYPFKNCQN